jgi:excisionase family DNA binding protein
MSSVSESQSGREPQHEDILTLPEAAAYLRVDEQGLADMAEGGNVPARKVAGQWRFSRRGLEDWMRFPGLHPGEYMRLHPRWLLESPFMDEFVHLIEKRLLLHLSQRQPEEPGAKPGSKQAVLKRFGVLRDAADGDLQEQLAAVRKRRETGG